MLSDRAKAIRLLRTPETARRRSMLAALLWSWRHARHVPEHIHRLIARERAEVLSKPQKKHRRSA